MIFCQPKHSLQQKRMQCSTYFGLRLLAGRVGGAGGAGGEGGGGAGAG